MVSVQYPLPKFTEQDAIFLARERYGISASAGALPGERDQNFYLKSQTGKEFVLKIANATEEIAVLELQNEVMNLLATKAPSLSIPRVCFTSDGEPITMIHSSEGISHYLRMLTYVPGKLLASVRPHTSEILRSLGNVLGTLDKALQSFEHQAAHRDLKWDLAKGSWIREYLSFISEPSQRKIVERFLHEFEMTALPVLPHLRKSIIYNDANDYNILVGGTNPWRLKVIGVIDFGDILHTHTVCNLAVGAAYAMLGKVDPLTAAARVIAGYHEVFPLSERDLEALYPLICMRLCVSVTNSAYQRSVEPDNKYLTISERPAWTLLEKLKDIHPRFAHYIFRDACRLPACIHTSRVTDWLKRNQAKIGPIVEPALTSKNSVTFDLSIRSPELGRIAEGLDAAALTKLLFGRLKNEKFDIGVGRYNEVRGINTGNVFRTEGNNGPEWRTIHLGLDLFQEPGSPVLAPLDGVIHSFRNNNASFDYGPAVILQHNASNEIVFYTLYGHLSTDSLNKLREGKKVNRGDRIGCIGTLEENGGWPPHLHFQIDPVDSNSMWNPEIMSNSPAEVRTCSRQVLYK